MESGLVRDRDGNKLLPNSQNGLPDAFNTLRIMKEAPILIIIENTNGLYPYSEIDADSRVTEIYLTLPFGQGLLYVYGKLHKDYRHPARVGCIHTIERSK